MNRLHLTAVLLVLVAAASGCSKGSSTSSTTTSTTSSSAAPAAPAPGKTVINGSVVYSANCSTCHGSTGAGQPGAFPPLAGNPLLSGDPAKVIAIVNNGLSGPVVIKGQTYNGQMPAWKNVLSANQRAAVITYVRTSWGNTGSVVTSGQVGAAK